MGVLIGTKRWRKRPAGQPRVRGAGALTPEESACVLVAIKFMIARLGSHDVLAQKMKTTRTSVHRALQGKPPPGAAFAIGIARVAGVTVDSVLSGSFPEPGACPHCGRSDAADAAQARG